MFVPHDPLDVERTFDRFVASVGGKRLLEEPHCESADYVFPAEGVIAELKTLKTDFPEQANYCDKIVSLGAAALERGELSVGQLFGMAPIPEPFVRQYTRVFRPPLQRVFKKANSQLKATRAILNLPQASGLVLLVNEGLYALPPQVVLYLSCDILSRLYTGIDAFVYITLNQYVDVPGSDLANLLWVPQYSEQAPNSLVRFVDRLGKQWGSFLESLIGDFQDRVDPGSSEALLGSRAIKRRHV